MARLTRLIGKGILKATIISKANYYEPCISEQEYLNFETKQFIETVHKGSMFGFINGLCDNGELITSGDYYIYIGNPSLSSVNFDVSYIVN